MASSKKLEVSVIQQNFTPSEKTQARTNIDAASTTSVTQIETDVDGIKSSATNWQKTFGVVSSQSANWNGKVDTTAFTPVVSDVDTLKANSAKLTVTGDDNRITVSTTNNTAQVSFNSAGLASETWVSAQIDELGKFQIVSADAEGKPAVQKPDDKTVYIVQESEGTSGGFTEWIWTPNGGYEQFGGFEVDLSPYQKLISAGSGIEIYGPDNNFISVTGDITPYSGTGIISVQDHIISALTADIRGGNGIGVNYGDNTISLSVSADYLSANALNDLSGNWESTYNTVQSNSANWENVSLKADQTWVEENYYPKSNPSGFITGVDLTDYYTKNETSSTNELNTEFEKYLEKEQYAVDSGTFLTAHQSLSAYATETYVDLHTSGKLDKTEASNTYQPKGDYVSSTDFETVSSLVEELVENSAHNVISSKNAFITVTTGSDNKTDLEFVSGDLASKSWVNENFSGNYLSATALDNLSSNWESAYNAITTSSDRWNSLFNTTIESTDGTVVITPHTNQNGDVLYDLAVSAEPIVCNTKLEANNGISAQFSANGTQSAWYIGLETSAKSAIDVVTNSKSTWDSVSNKLDSSVYAAESGNFLTAHQSLEGYATTSWVSSEFATLDDLVHFATETYVLSCTSGKADKTEIPDVSNFITFASAAETYQPLGNYLSSNALVGYATESWVTGQNYITGVDLTPYQTTAGMTAYQPVGDYLTADALVSYSGNWNTVSAKLDKSAFSDVSGTFLTAVPANYATTSDLQQTSGNITALIPTDYYPDSNPSGFISGVDLTPYATTVQLLDYQLTANMSGYTQTADFSTVSGYVETLKTASSTWDNVTAKLDETAFSTVSSTFLTAHQSLSSYYMKSETSGASELDAALSAKQDSLSQSQLSAISSVSSKLNTTAFSTVSGNFVQSTGTSAIKTVLMVSQLPASPSTSVLYLIPE